MWLPLSLLQLLLLSATATTRGILVNRTIDDQKGDSVTGAVPDFLPVDRWNIGQTCTRCSVHSGVVDPGKTFDGTWHDGTHYDATDSNMTVVVNFTGSAIYIYNILANTVPHATTLTILDFYLDDNYMGTFEHVPDETAAVVYNALVYKNTSIPHGPHSLQAVSSGPQKILALFDYAVYTVEDDSTPPSSTSLDSVQAISTSLTSPTTVPAKRSQANIPAAVGGAVGGMVVLGAVVTFAWLRRRRTRRRQRTSSLLLHKGLPQGWGNPLIFAIGPHSHSVSNEQASRRQTPSRKALSVFEDRGPTIPDASLRSETASVFDGASMAGATDCSVALMRRLESLQAQIAELRAATGPAVAGTRRSGSDFCDSPDIAVDNAKRRL
ncbi:hypothetical protein C8Q77DRAFT_865645 [Trametes polyzona]|nr:hypothetical protein C8Q77DRAFT_865645 [Trametes polyzona]